MKIAVEFPSIVYREGPAGVASLVQAIERIGYDEIDMFDHVVMGYPIEGRNRGPYPADMPILEALATLAFCAAITERIGLGTEVLVLPQRQPALVAKQISTIDTLSGGRVRLGVGVGWQESEFEALGADFSHRGRVMDEAIRLLRVCWREKQIDFPGRYIKAEAIAMEPKPPRAGGPPIWVGGGSPAALKRAGTLGDGWLAGAGGTAEQIATVKRHAERSGRDPGVLGFQTQLAPPVGAEPEVRRGFYGDPDAVAAAAGRAAAQGFGWVTLNVTSVFQAGARSSAQMVEALANLHDRIRHEVGT
jgi:probable F420-dependent oxidoreductase